VTTPSASDRIVVDSSGWIEYLGNGPKADRFATHLQSQTAILLLPSIIAYEVHKKLCRESDRVVADRFLSQAMGFKERLIHLTLELAVSAADISIETGLPMADAIIYATARRFEAQLITSDAHFANLPRVTLV
jgi:predicted nucleic acid-binding protein